MRADVFAKLAWPVTCVSGQATTAVATGGFADPISLSRAQRAKNVGAAGSYPQLRPAINWGIELKWRFAV